MRRAGTPRSLSSLSGISFGRMSPSPVCACDETVPNKNAMETTTAFMDLPIGFLQALGCVNLTRISGTGTLIPHGIVAINAGFPPTQCRCSWRRVCDLRAAPYDAEGAEG